MKKQIFFLCIFLSSILGQSSAYIFGMKSADNSIENISKIEEKYKIKIDVPSFIFDPFGEQAIESINNLKTKLGDDRIFHLTISPDMYSAEDVAKGKFDHVYRNIFKKIKQEDIRVIFRTMHEMNGGRYPRASDPENFKKARIHVRKLSREEGLNEHNILFDFSVNHRDMPTKEKPSQTATLIECSPDKKFKEIKIPTGTKTIKIIKKKAPNPLNGIGQTRYNTININTQPTTKTITKITYKTKKKQVCFSFEDYYPGDKYVDIFGFTFFNRGKATSDRKRLTPKQILYDKKRNTLKRIKSFHKPIFIDEVGTTAVYYTGYYNTEKSKQLYETKRDKKNYRIMHLKNFLQTEPGIIGASYFNTDYTYGLSHPNEREADRSAINLRNNKIYYGIFDLAENAEKNTNKLLDLFRTKRFEVNNKAYFIHEEQLPSLISFSENIYQKYNNSEELLIELNKREIQINQDTTISKQKKAEFLKNIAILQSINGKNN